MSNVHTQTIPLYNKGALSATGYRIGSGYNVKLNYGTVELASKPSLYECILHSYIGIRLKSPKFHSWLTEDLRTQILKELREMDGLIDGRITTYRNEGLKEILNKGMRWELDNTLHIRISEGDLHPEERIREMRELFFNDVMKAAKLVVHIRMMSDFRSSDDLFEVSLFEDKQKGSVYMSVMESNLPSSLFNQEWIDNAKNSFNAYRRASAPVQPGFNPAVYHPNAPVQPGIQIPAQQFGVGISEQNPLYTYGSGTGTPAQFKLYGKTGDVDITLNGSTVSLQATSVSIESPKIDVVNHDAQGYVSPRLSDMPDAPQITADGTGIFKMSKVMADKIESVALDVYHKLPYINAETRLPISFQEFVETKLKWSWADTTFENYLLCDYKPSDQGRDPQVESYIKVASALCGIVITTM